MVVEHTLKFTKTQAKMMDCWYACTQMIRSAAGGAVSVPTGHATQAHRAMPVVGQRLAFTSTPGRDIMMENNLIDVTSRVRLNDINTLAKALQTNGPLIACGKFALFNTQGHCIVIAGCDTTAATVSIYDPGWGQGRQTKPWSYIVEHLHKLALDANVPGDCALVADNPAPFFAQATRARR